MLSSAVHNPRREAVRIAQKDARRMAVEADLARAIRGEVTRIRSFRTGQGRVVR